MKFNWAILSVLAERPGGWASLDDLKVEVSARAPQEHRSEKIVAALEDVDIFQSGLVIPEDGGLRVTDGGRAALRALEASDSPSVGVPTPPSSASLKTIDHLIGTEERLKIFGLELDPSRANAEDPAPTPVPPVAPAEAEPPPPPEAIVPIDALETDDAAPLKGEAITIAPRPARAGTAPVVVVRDGSSSGAGAHDGTPPKRPSAIAAGFQQAAAIWRRHLERDAPDSIPAKRSRTSGGIAVLITLLVLIICAGAVVAVTQIRSLQSEVSALQRELSPLRERVARAEFLEKAKQNADQQKEAQNRASAETNKTSSPPRTEQVALSLTPDEIRLIRDFIKPAPAAATPAPAINVGDTVSIATIPLPSQLMERIPKLLGARFTTRNGSIIILKRDSRQADVVLPPN